MRVGYTYWTRRTRRAACIHSCGRAYLQLLQPVFTLGLLALLRPSLEAEWELEEDIGQEIYAEWQGRSDVR